MPLADTTAALSTSIDQLRSLTEMLQKDLSAAKARIAELESVVHPKRKNEKYYQRILEDRLGAKHLWVPGVGETDLTTDDAHIELKKWSEYDDVPGQLAKYNLIIPRPRRCGYFFGPLPGKKRIAFIEALMKSFGIEMYSFDADDDVHRHGKEEDSGQSERSIFTRFRTECLVDEDGDRLEWTVVLPVFQAWAKATGFEIEEKKGTVRRIFVAGLGKIYDSRFKGISLYGWKNVRLTEEALKKWSVQA